jgi:hypothetical protein
MNRWNELITSPRAGALRILLRQAAATAHAENAERFAADDLGDNARTYGICTSNTARFLAGRAIEDAAMEGVTVCERGMLWWLEVERDQNAMVRVYFYKAPPAANTVWDLRLDDAEVKKQLSKSNGQQLELFKRDGGLGHAELLNVIVVHYGDPHGGFGKVDVGAPYITRDALAWEWHERFDSAEIEEGAGQAARLGDDAGSFEGLKLIDPIAADDLSAATGPEATGSEEKLHETAEPDFDEMRLRDEPDDENSESGETGEESS